MKFIEKLAKNESLKRFAKAVQIYADTGDLKRLDTTEWNRMEYERGFQDGFRKAREMAADESTALTALFMRYFDVAPYQQVAPEVAKNIAMRLIKLGEEEV